MGIAWFLMILAFAPQAIYSQIIVFTGSPSLIDPAVLTQASLMAFAVGASFILHELGHKFAAQRFHGRAAYRLDRQGLLYTIVSIFLGIYLLVPGAVFWESDLAQYDNVRGRVAASGPMVNLVLASISLGLIGLGLNAPEFSLEWILFSFGWISFYLNVYLGLFNLVPVWILDGRKIFAWNETVWLTMVMLFASLALAGFIGVGMRFSFFIFTFPP